MDLKIVVSEYSLYVELLEKQEKMGGIIPLFAHIYCL